MIEQCSEEVEYLTRRYYAKKQRVEYYTSLEQVFGDPVPQFVLLNAYPVDTGAAFTMEWSPNDYKDELSVTLESTDYTLDAEKGKVSVKSAGGLVNSLAILYSKMFTYAERGFRITYTGGYAVTTEPVGNTADPLDDFGVVQVPEGLKLLVAQKVAKEFKLNRFYKPFSDEERPALKPWTKKDRV